MVVAQQDLQELCGTAASAAVVPYGAAAHTISTKNKTNPYIGTGTDYQGEAPCQRRKHGKACCNCTRHSTCFSTTGRSPCACHIARHKHYNCKHGFQGHNFYHLKAIHIAAQ
eukprot:9268800-Ditylum_brightwellii.AAC.1